MMRTNDKQIARGMLWAVALGGIAWATICLLRFDFESALTIALCATVAGAVLWIEQEDEG